MVSRAIIGNVVLGLGVVGLGALVVAERNDASARREAEAQSVPAAAAAAAPGAPRMPEVLLTGEGSGAAPSAARAQVPSTAPSGPAPAAPAPSTSAAGSGAPSSSVPPASAPTTRPDASAAASTGPSAASSPGDGSAASAPSASVPGPASSPAAGAGAPSGAASASASRAAAEAALERAIDAATAGDEDEDEAEDEVYDPEGPEERAIASAAQRRAPEPAREDELGCDAPAGDPPGVSISRPGATAPGASAAAVPTASPLLALIPAAKVDRHVVRPGDTLTALARAHKVTIGLVRRLNGIQGDRIRVGATLAIPRGPFSAAVERASFSLAIDLDGSPVKKYAVGVGRDGSTPAGEFEVRTRVENPDWTSPEGDYFRSGDAANPLGTRWLGFGADGYGIHGTTDPSSIGREASRGCVRLNPGDVEEVYDFLTIGSRVTIR